MDLRDFFITHCWWGKLMTAFFGYLVAGAPGALLGLLIGNFFDRGLSQFFASSFWYYRAEKNKEVQQIFLQTLFAVMGHMAKADGAVTKASIHWAKSCMKEMRLNREQEQLAQKFFKLGKEPNFDLAAFLSMFYTTMYAHPKLLKLFIDTQYQTSQIDGPSTQKQYLMNAILRRFNFAPIYEEPMFEDVTDIFEQHRQTSWYSSTQHERARAAPSQQTPTLEQSFKVLNIPSTATHQEVKRAYRRLMSRYHPDKLIAKKASEDEIREANEKTQRIRKAYEQICSVKGWD